MRVALGRANAQIARLFAPHVRLGAGALSRITTHSSQSAAPARAPSFTALPPQLPPEAYPKASTLAPGGRPTLSIVQQLINNIMRDGKKKTAQALVNEALLYVQKRTNDNPVLLLVKVVDRVSPFVKTQSIKQGSRSVLIPTPLNERQRKKIGFKWLIDQVNRTKTPVTSFGTALGQEMLKVLNGTSALLQKPLNMHKQALQNKSNVRMRDRELWRGRRRR